MDMPRRQRKNLDLPRNLYPNGKYFYYRNPRTGKKVSLNCSRQEAIELAKEANALLTRAPAIIVKDDYIPDILDRFEREFLPEKEYAASTLTEIRIKLNRYRKEFKRNMRDLDVRILSAWLDNLSRSAYIKHRGLWVDIYRYAISKGLTTFNVAEATLVKKPAPRQRDRLSLDDYKAIHKIAEPWFQVAMDAALYTLQRRGDLVQIKLDSLQDGALPIIQAKTGTAIKILANDGLKAVFQRSRWSGVGSPYLIHRKPLKRRRTYMDRKAHYTQVSPDMLTKEFLRLRKKAGLETTATFHEIRSLGGRLLIEQGFPSDFVQVLMGHASEKMTQHYLEDGRINWKQAEAGLRL